MVEKKLTEYTRLSAFEILKNPNEKFSPRSNNEPAIISTNNIL
jgi:hypothetical protein